MGQRGKTSPVMITALSLALLAGCGGDGTNPFQEDPEEPTEDGGDGGDGGTGDGFDLGGGGTPPGIDGPSGSVTSQLVRYEERNDNGGGYAEEFAYDSDTDTFTVDNLAFDGDNTYERGTAVASLGPNSTYAVYEADVTVPDGLNGDPVSQIQNYRAIVGISGNSVSGEPRTSFAIVRTGGYVQYGFGGFVYERRGGAVIPTTGQGTFEGDYAGVRIFDGRGGMEYVEGDMEMRIDFEDPNATNGVAGSITNRVGYDPDGNLVTLGNDGEAGELPLPDIRWVLDGEGNMSADGEMTGEVFSTYVDPDGNEVQYEDGNYYAILAGDATDGTDGGEVVGVLVVESDDPRFDGVTAQETGGFILSR